MYGPIARASWKRSWHYQESNIANSSARCMAPADVCLSRASSCCTDPRRSQNLPVPSGNQRRHIREHARQRETAWICEIDRFPLRAEFVLERAHALKIVERLAM